MSAPRNRVASAARAAFALGSFGLPLAVLGAFTFGGCSSDPTVSPPPLALRDDDAAKPDGRTNEPADTSLPTEPDAGGPRGTIFVESGRVLQTYDPYSKALKTVGPFTCLPTDDFMFDIAVDRDSNIYGVTRLDRFVKVDPLTGACTVIRQGTGLEFPSLIAFVPRGTLDLANDALVGYEGEKYLRVDVRTGAVTEIGTLNPPDASTPYEAAGDLVSAGQNGMFLTATLTTGATDAGDFFVRFDPKTGRRLSLVGNTGYERLFGLGYWGGRIFAFTTPGEILQVDPRTAKATLVKRVPGDDAGNEVFFGAGSTTVAPETPTP